MIGAIAGAAPPGVSELGPDVWRGDKPPNQRGMVVLGSPVGHPDFMAAWTAQRMAQEQELLEHLPFLPDLQCAWLLLALCASPRANHALRTVPPPDISLYAQAHDAAMWATLLELLGGASDTTEAAFLARTVASLPAALGGLGLQSASRLAPAAYWAAWADSLPVIQARFPDMAAQLQRHLGDDNARCLAHADAARRLLITEGWGDCPNWHDITGGLLAAPHAEAGLGDWPHGWQFHASRTRNLYYRDRVLLPTLPPDHRALLRSQSGPHAGSWLAAIPGEAATTLSPEAMQVALRRRLRLPLPIASGRCGPSPGGGGPVDLLGDHALACPRTGLLARRAKVVERAWIRVAREAVGPEGHIVPQPWLAHTTAPRVEPTDRRRLDLLIYGATPNGIALCCDATLVSPLTRTGQPQPCGADVDGAALRVAERRKRATYPELAAAGPQRLIVLGAEVGGRWPRFGARSGSGPRISSPTRRPARRQVWLGTQVVEHPVGGRAAGRSRHGPRLCLADGLVDLHSRRSTAGTRARVSGRGCRQQAATPGVASPAEAAQLKTDGLVV